MSEDFLKEFLESFRKETNFKLDLIDERIASKNAMLLEQYKAACDRISNNEDSIKRIDQHTSVFQWAQRNTKAALFIFIGAYLLLESLFHSGLINIQSLIKKLF